MQTHRMVMVDWSAVWTRTQGLSMRSEENVELINDVCHEYGMEQWHICHVFSSL